MGLKLTYKTEENVLKERMIDDVVLLQFPLLEKSGLVKHGFSTRLGGVSKGIYSTMNLSFSRGDKEEDVRENYRRIAKALDVPEDSFVLSHQTHTTNVVKVTKADCGNGLTRPLSYQNVDGLITNEPDVCLTTFYADCVPLYFVDPVKKAIGLSHSGWRGTVGKMGKCTVEQMQKEFGCNPKDMIAAVGPSICQTCYEVSEDVVQEFQAVFEKKDWNQIFYKKDNGKYQLDLWKANELILIEAGIPRTQIAITNLCTCCNPEVLFSHRASDGKRGNLAAFLALK